jgi:diguanylate cyclase (GGDEF)-like protein
VSVDPAHTDVHGPFGKLIRMLLPRAGTVTIYDKAGEALWLSDGCEEPEVHELVVERLRDDPQQIPRSGEVIITDGGERICLFRLCGPADKRLLGVLAVDLGEQGSSSDSMIISFLQPVVECIEHRMAIEQNLASLSRQASHGNDLDLLLAVDDSGDGDSNGLEQLVASCVEHLECAVGALVIPEKGVTICRHADAAKDGESAGLLTRTEKHLLAWAQLNDRPMVVNRVIQQAGNDAPPYKILSCPIREPNKRVAGILGMFRDPQAPDFELRDVRILELMSRKAVTLLDNSYDSFTGLLNRPAFEREVQVHLDEPPPEAGHGLLYIDIDKLHIVNNAFGFAAGDEIIRRFADVTRERLGHKDLMGRIAGDRFAILLVDRNLDDSRGVAEDLREAMGGLRYLKGDRTVSVSISVGVAPCTAGGQRFAHALAAAEVACKAAKDRGRNRVEVFEEDDLSLVKRHNDIYVFAGLQEALRQDQFRLDAQPICPLQTDSREPTAFEVLVRLQNPAGELVAPDKFLSAAERYQLMPAIDRWVFMNTLNHLRGSVDTLVSRSIGFTINISGQSLGSDGFLQFLVSHLRTSGVPPQLLCFEVTETAAVANLDRAEAFIAEMTKLGCRFALDDFGSGLSSFAYLRNLRVHTLKIDGSFVREAAKNQISESMVVAITQVARVMGLSTVAEYVESESIAEKLRTIGVDFGQGFHLGRPRPLQAVLADLAPGPAQRVVATA